jgi:hypothetical protein
MADYEGQPLTRTNLRVKMMAALAAFIALGSTDFGHIRA